MRTDSDHTPRILVVGSGNGRPGEVVETLTGAGHDVEVAVDVSRALARLRDDAPPVVLAHGGPGARGLRIDVEGQEAFLDGERLSLTPLEFQLLRVIVEGAGRTVTRDAIMERLWGVRWNGDHHALDVHVSNLRGKLGDAAVLITTVRGVGLRLAGA